MAIEEANGYIGFGDVFRLSIIASTLDSYFLRYGSFFSENLTDSVSIIIFLAMASSVPLVPNYVYVAIRL